MAEYKGKLLKGLYTFASKALRSNGTDVDTSITNVEGDISTLQSTISGRIVKRANANLTTTADGYAVVNKADYKHVVSVCPITRAAISFVYQANASQWVIYIKDAGTFAPVASTQVNVDIFYTD